MEQVAPTHPVRVTVAISEKSRTISLVLCLFLGWLGIHRFYVGKMLSGILYLLTFGVFGLGILFDLVVILTGNFKDTTGGVVREW
ncbi:MAG: TM2 domain-containing protein [Candidatus Heimdallarchaeota archaeon]